MYSFRIFIMLLCCFSIATAQKKKKEKETAAANGKKPVTLEEIWLAPTYYPKSAGEIRWMKDDNFYTDFTGDGALLRKSVLNKNQVDTLIRPAELTPAGAKTALDPADYGFSPDESKIFICTNQKPIYRWSRLQTVYIFDFKTRQLKPVFEGKEISNPHFSPDANKLGFTFENNLYYQDFTAGNVVQVTKDGEKNKIINGSTDWVYEEELELVRAFDWSADGKRLAWLRFDESQVPEYSMQIYGGLYPQSEKFKYPKAGEKNSVVSCYIYDLTNGKTVTVDLGSETDQYIPRLKWTPNSLNLAVLRLNRLQNKLEYLAVDAISGAAKVILTENSTTYIEVSNSTWNFLQSGTGFYWLSERDGYAHLYQYDLSGRLIRQVTKGEWEVREVHGIDEKNNWIYYTGTEVSPLTFHLYRCRLDGTEKQQLTTQTGMHDVELSPNFSYFIDNFSNCDTPPTYTLLKTDGTLIRVLEDNKELKNRLAQKRISPKTFFKCKISGDIELNGWMIKPHEFDEKKKYPVIMFCYGGPGSQTVQNKWGGFDFMFYQTLAEMGYIIVSVDNRGTGARGEAFKKVTYKQLGKLEAEDQIAAANYLKTLPYVDGARIGIWGWSFGGYLTALCLVKSDNTFKAGISVAPVTNWRFYDTIYTERFLQTPQLNPAGYDDNSPINFANRLKANYLLIHGTADDNVHFQNAADWVTALVNANKQFQSFYYPNKNHGIYGGYTRYHLYQMMTNFWKNNL